MFFLRSLILSVLMVLVCCAGVFVFGANLSMINPEKVLVIGIAGGTGSGKTTFTKALADELKAVFGHNATDISHDSY